MTDLGSPFYSQLGLNVETYDARVSVELPEFLEGDLEFYVSHAFETGGPVLELGCGTGRVAWHLARGGFDVVGLDKSDPMICAAEAKRWQLAEEVQPRATFVEADMASFDLKEHSFPLIIIPYRTFQALVEPEEQRSCLQCIRRHLAPEGWLILDLFDPRLEYLTVDSGHVASRKDIRAPLTGNPVSIEVLSRENDPASQVFTEVWRFTEKAGADEIVRQEEEILKLRWTYRWELRYLLELTGFEIEAEYSDFQGAPPEYGKEQVLVIKKA
ncbi:MAG: class I SAM-dependent methyltransferase [Planctomycetota bacterium]